MKKAIKLFGIIAFVALIGFSFAACGAVGLGGGGSGGGSGDITGTWEGDMYGYTASITFTADGRWTASMPGWGYETGTYTRSGNNITLFVFHYDYGRDVEVGSAVLLNSDSMRFTIIGGTEFDGTYIAYKVR